MRCGGLYACPERRRPLCQDRRLMFVPPAAILPFRPRADPAQIDIILNIMFVIGLSFSASRLRFWRKSARPVGHNGLQISEVGGVPKTGHRNAIGDSTLDAASELSRPSSKERQAHAGVIGEALETVGV